MNTQSSLQLTRAVLTAEAQALSHLAETAGDEVRRAVEMLATCKGKVVVAGMGKSAIIAQKIASTMCSLGTPAAYLHAGDAVHGDSGMLTSGDILIAVSRSGETAETLALIPLARSFGCRIISLTASDCCTLARQADVSLWTHVEREADPRGIAPTASTTAAMALGDALALCLAEIKGFTPADFLARHPAGTLGAAVARSIEAGRQ
ncbi:MAG: KpsF/GutQ family sugar-phosphate isomerase [Bacillota bacterium]